MRLILLCIGRLRASAESVLAKDFAARATAVGRAVGLGPVEIVELAPRKSGKAAEGEAILDRLGGATLIALDEHGQTVDSRAFAALLAARRGAGASALAFAIGGAEGLAPSVTRAAGQVLSLGPMTWPHGLARAMLAEQIYRAATILTGGPYHRG
ncbi:MAG TPA: 23S rRNA (pseudouridine(1915)-N(3))-methyltransferase RlmH [Caulobacteraceae bacterium]|nr:23S rRNA (pseudouridine(1915)-N(3))-methyltransferase RlmH [Caulobacteraceae bacterium]